MKERLANAPFASLGCVVPRNDKKKGPLNRRQAILEDHR